MSRKMTDWIETSTSPTGHEIDRLVAPLHPELLETVRDCTEPTEGELNRLLRSRANLQIAAREPSWVRGWAPALAAAAVVVGVGVWMAQPPGYGPIGSELGQVAEWHGQTFELGPSIDVTANGSLRVAQADKSGTVIDMLSGSAEFSVDPGGLYRRLVIEAKDVEVEVKGTVFDVGIRDDGAVWVGCSRGKVAVRHAGVERFVTAGERWSTAELAVQLAQAPVEPIAPAVADAAVETTPIAERPASSAGARPRAVAVAHELPVVAEDEAPSARDTSARDFVRIQRLNARGGAPDGVVAQWDAFLARWPDAIEAPEGRVRRLQALVRVQPTRATMEQIQALLASSPRHDLLMALHELRGELGEGPLNDCASVTDSFAWLASYGDSAQSATASASLGLCPSTDPAVAANALNRALALGIADRELRSRVVQALAALESDPKHHRGR